jgi:catechol 2,3-dioxygenase-like lactoylglutathione lyase family enzyme
MNRRLFDHIDLRVKNRAAAQEFYAQILPAIGFRVDKSGVDYSPGYYAVFFEDPDGNKLEVCCRESATIAE